VSHLTIRTNKFPVTDKESNWTIREHLVNANLVVKKPQYKTDCAVGTYIHDNHALINNTTKLTYVRVD